MERSSEAPIRGAMVMSLPPRRTNFLVPEALVRDAVAWRHELHRHPEILFDLPWTAGFVAQKLQSFGFDRVVRGVGGSGVVGVLEGRTNRRGKVIGLRADMDALPVEEATGLAYRSVNGGRMHACGHDGHMAMLLGAARVLSETREFDGTLVFIFQPAEEGGAGAKAMLDDGLVENFSLQQVYGMHIMPGIAVGDFASREGVIMASSDRFSCTIRGTGGHAALPHRAADPVLAASNAVMGLQSIVARDVDPLDPVVVSVTGLRAGAATNVIPETAWFGGTVRTVRAETRDLVEKRLAETVRGIALSYKTMAEVEYRRGYSNTVNHPGPTSIARRSAEAVVGPSGVDWQVSPTMAAEDFSFMLEMLPGNFTFLGNGDSASLHSPNFVFNDESISYGIAYWVSLSRTLSSETS